MKTEIGWIRSATFGLGGYQDCQFGLHLTFGGKSWGVSTSEGDWAWSRIPHSEHTKWTEAQRDAGIVAACRLLDRTLTHAGKENVAQLVGTPVEVVFEGGMLKSWRVLTEAIAESKECV